MTTGGLWSRLIGQQEAIATLQAAVRDAKSPGESGPAMTHAWLITGPPGSGRSRAATTFAAALVCDEGGCGHCQACRTSAKGGHADIHVEIPEGSEILLDHVKPLVHMAAQAPMTASWRVIVIEDAERGIASDGGLLFGLAVVAFLCSAVTWWVDRKRCTL